MELVTDLGHALLSNPEVIGLICTGFAGFLTYVFGKVGNNILKEQSKTQIKEIAVAATHELLPLAAELLNRESKNEAGEIISPAGTRTPEEDAKIVEEVKAKMIDIAERSGTKIKGVVAPEVINAVVHAALARFEGKAPQAASSSVKSLFPMILAFVGFSTLLTGCITTGGLVDIAKDLREIQGWSEAQPENIVAIADHIGAFLGSNSDASILERDMILSSIAYGAADYYFLSKGQTDFDTKMKHAFNTANEFAQKNFDGVLKGERLDVYLSKRLGLSERLTEAEYIFGYMKYAVDHIKP